MIALPKLAGNPISEAEYAIEDLLQSDYVEGVATLIEPFCNVVGIDSSVMKELDSLGLLHRDLGQQIRQFGSLAAMGVNAQAFERRFSQAESARCIKCGAVVVPNINCFSSHFFASPLLSSRRAGPDLEGLAGPRGLGAGGNQDIREVCYQKVVSSL